MGYIETCCICGCCSNAGRLIVIWDILKRKIALKQKRKNKINSNMGYIETCTGGKRKPTGYQINSNMGYIETKFFYVVRESTPWINSNMGYIETVGNTTHILCMVQINSNMGYIETIVLHLLLLH